MTVISSFDREEGVITLVNNWEIRTGRNDESGMPETIISIYYPDGTRYSIESILLDTSEPEEVVDEFVDWAEGIDELRDLPRLEEADSQSVRVIARALPDFDSV